MYMIGNLPNWNRTAYIFPGWQTSTGIGVFDPDRLALPGNEQLDENKRVFCRRIGNEVMPLIPKSAISDSLGIHKTLIFWFTMAKEICHACCHTSSP